MGFGFGATTGTEIWDSGGRRGAFVLVSARCQRVCSPQTARPERGRTVNCCPEITTLPSTKWGNIAACVSGLSASAFTSQKGRTGRNAMISIQRLPPLLERNAQEARRSTSLPSWVQRNAPRAATSVVRPNIPPQLCCSYPRRVETNVCVLPTWCNTSIVAVGDAVGWQRLCQWQRGVGWAGSEEELNTTAPCVGSPLATPVTAFMFLV